MDVADKLEILADAAKYDVACTSSGIDRDAQKGKMGNTLAAGMLPQLLGRRALHHACSKVLMTNVCVYDCAYCVNRCAATRCRAPPSRRRELADLTIAFYRRNYIGGAVLKLGRHQAAPTTPPSSWSRRCRILRDEYGFRGYIHAKAVPGTSPALVDRAGASGRPHEREHGAALAEEPGACWLPTRASSTSWRPCARSSENIAEDKDTRALMRKETRRT